LDSDVEVKPLASTHIGPEQTEAAAGSQDLLKRLQQVCIFASKVE
jgi:hypothetical protein